MRQMLTVLPRELHSNREMGRGGENQASTASLPIFCPVLPTQPHSPAKPNSAADALQFSISVFALAVFSACNVISSEQLARQMSVTQ